MNIPNPHHNRPFFKIVLKISRIILLLTLLTVMKLAIKIVPMPTSLISFTFLTFIKEFLEQSYQVYYNHLGCWFHWISFIGGILHLPLLNLMICAMLQLLLNSSIKQYIMEEDWELSLKIKKTPINKIKTIKTIL